jgi:hypothetical protein
MRRISQLFAVAAATLLLSAAAAAQSRYTQFGNLNNNSVNVTSAWTKLSTTDGAHTFRKVGDKTRVEVIVNSRFGVGALGGGATGVRFQVRVDDKVVPSFDNMGSILAGNTREFLSIFAVFEDLPAILNRHRAELRAGGHRNRELQKDWAEFGAEAFEFEVLDTLAPPDGPDYDPAGDLRALKELWLDKLSPYGERGYNPGPKRPA